MAKDGKHFAHHKKSSSEAFLLSIVFLGFVVALLALFNTCYFCRVGYLKSSIACLVINQKDLNHINHKEGIKPIKES